MKKKFSLIITAILLILSLQTAFASKFTEFGIVRLLENSTGNFHELTPVNVVVKGQDIVSDTPPVVFGTRTMVPIASIFNALDISYLWVAETNQIHFSANSKSIVLTLDDEFASIDGQKVRLPDGVPPRVFTYFEKDGDAGISRTYVPLRFVSEILGFETIWQSTTNTAIISSQSQQLKNIYINDSQDYKEIRLSLTGKVDYSSFYISGADVGGKDSIVVDLQNTRISKDYQEPKNINIDGIISIHSTSTSSGNLRVNITQKMRKGYDIYYDYEKNDLVIKLINSVTGFEIKKLYGTDTVILNASEDVLVNQYIDNNKLIVDVIDSYFQGKSGEFPINQGKIQSISISQLDIDTVAREGYFTEQLASGQRSKQGEVTRMVVTLDAPINYDEVYIENLKNEVFVYVAENKTNDFNYSKESSFASEIVIETKDKFSGEIDFDNTQRVLSVNIPKNIAMLDLFDYDVKDNLVSNISIKDKESFYSLNIHLADNTTYFLASDPASIKINFINKTIENSRFTDKLIVVDAGHGGKDPGALGKRTQEKVVALKTSQKLEEELKKLGFKVYMTRNTDEYIGRYDRATIANSLGADLFISIHYNAHTNSKVNGLEVLYARDSEKPLASIVQKNIVESLGGVNRGVKKIPNIIVLRETQMPAVLAELGFVSNPEEEARLINDDYQSKAAYSIAKSIEEYFQNK